MKTTGNSSPLAACRVSSVIRSARGSQVSTSAPSATSSRNRARSAPHRSASGPRTSAAERIAAIASARLRSASLCVSTPAPPTRDPSDPADAVDVADTAKLTALATSPATETGPAPATSAGAAPAARAAVQHAAVAQRRQDLRDARRLGQPRVRPLLTREPAPAQGFGNGGGLRRRPVQDREVGEGELVLRAVPAVNRP